MMSHTSLVVSHEYVSLTPVPLVGLFVIVLGVWCLYFNHLETI